MTPGLRTNLDRWPRIAAILDLALELPPEERSALLDETCAGDAELRAEVEALLAADAEAGAFLETPAGEFVPELLAEAVDEEESETADLAGHQVGRYRLLREIGSGGMGTVYEAEDTQLGRRVAVKLLPPEYSRDRLAKERFLREARTAAAVDHPNLCTVHDAGESEGRLYIVLSFYEGETLRDRIRRGPLPLAEAREIAMQVARGLARAHEAGIVHRDVKPANVMLPRHGEAKVLDFGIARLKGDEASLTRTGTSWGTPAYMSPEHARGEPVDGRTDVWSLGVMLYEMVAGRRPFGGESVEALVSSILTQEATPLEHLRPDVPPELARVVERALAKDPAERYANAAEMLVDLESGRALGRRPTRRKVLRVGLLAAALALIVLLVVLVWRPWRLATVWNAWSRHEARQVSGQLGVKAKDEIRIVVLPFENLGKPEDPYFAAGLTEEITANLSLLPQVQVIPGRNVLGDKGVAKPLSEIGEELGVDYVLRGTVNWRTGQRQVRVIPQLTSVSGEANLQIAPVEGNARSPFTAQQEISRAVISTLDITLTPEQSLNLGKRSTANPEAYRAYVQGLVLKDQPFYSPPHLEKAATMFEQAVETDPDFAEAWAELSQVHSYLAFNTDRSSKRLEQARRAMEKAVALGADLVATRLAQAYFSYRCLEDYDAAFEHLTAAARMAPNLPEVLEMRGLLLRRTGHLTEAVAELKKAAALNPRTARLVWTLAETYGALREYEQADAYFERAISLAPDEPFNYEQRAYIRLAWTGNLNEARAILEDSPVRNDPQLQLAAVHFDLYERKYQQALTRLSPESKEKLSFANQARLAALSVLARERLGDHPGALALAETNLHVLNLRMAQYSRHPLFRVYLAMALAQLGRSEKALAYVEQAVQQSQHDAFSGPLVVEDQAMVAATLGHRREAVALLGRLLRTPYRAPISVAKLRLDPVWDRLRGDPGFEALLREHEK